MAAKDARKSADPTVHLSGGLALRNYSYKGYWLRQVETHAGNSCKYRLPRTPAVHILCACMCE